MAIPRRPLNVVPTAPLPNVRTPTDVPALAFRSPVVPDLTPIVGEVNEFVQRQREHADHVMLLDADNQLAALESGIRRQTAERKGKDVLGVGDTVTTDWQKGVQSIEQGLGTDRQREAFRLRAASRFIDLRDATDRHAHDEWTKFDTETTKAAITNRMNDALANYGDSESIARNLVEARSLIQAAGARMGWSDEQIKEKVDTTLSAVHSGVVNRYLNAGDDRGAAAYYAKAKSQIVGQDTSDIEKALDIGSTRGTSQREADRILSAIGLTGSLDQAMAEAAKLGDDPKVREATEQRLRTAFADRAASDRDQRFQAYQDAGNILERTKSVDAIPPATWNLLGVTERRALTERQDQLRHPRRQTDLGLFATLMNMAGLNPQTRQDFEQIDLSQFATQLDENDFERLLSLQLQLREATRAGDVRAEGLGEEVPDRTRPPDLRLSVPPQWIQAAQTNPRYKAYLQHMGVFVSQVPLPVRP